MSILEKRRLGQTGLEVSCLGLGTVKFGRNQGVKYPHDFDLPDDNAVRSLLDNASELGINLLDTAPAYGVSEERLGRLLKDTESWVVCSKVGEEFQNGQSIFDFSAGNIRSSVERSLRRLNRDWLDIVLVHSDGNDLAIIDHSDCIDELQKIKQSGLIRSFGISTKTVEGGLRAVQCADVVMISFNPLVREDEKVIEEAAKRDRGVLVKKGLLSGHLDSLPDSSIDPVEQSLRFIFSKQGISSVIVGTINNDHLKHNAECATRAIERLAEYF